MIHKPLHQILPSDLQDLINNSVPESRTLEYKREAPGLMEQHKVKLLRTICAFANTDGGDMIFGISEDEGLPTEIVGIERSQIDEVKLRCEQLMRDCIEPRLPKTDIVIVDVNEDRCVLIIRVQRSWLNPHQITVGNHIRFYGRNSAETYALDVSQLREAFSMSEQHADRARKFVVDRVLKVEQGNGPVNLADGAKLILHVIPLSALSTRRSTQFQVNLLDRTNFPLFMQSTRSARANLDGFVVYDSMHGYRLCRMFTQVFRSGIVETVVSFPPHHEGSLFLYGKTIENSIIVFLKNVFSQLQMRSMDGPYIICVGMVHHSNYQLMDVDAFAPDLPLRKLEDVTILPDIMIEDWENVSNGAELKPLFDALWNAFEYDCSPSYDELGIRRQS